MTLPPRTRTESKREESNVTGFVDSTVNFETNCSFFELTADKAAKEQTASHVLLLAPTAAAAAEKFAGLPVFTDIVKGSLDSAAEGKIYALSVGSGDALRRVLIGLLPTAASRYTNPMRPDAITALVEAALGDGKGVKELDVLSAVPAEYELAVAQAVAKASHTFSAKSGNWDKGYMNDKLAKVRVFLQGPLLSSPAALRVVAHSVQLAARLVDAPTNLLDTTTFPQIAAGYAAKLGGLFTCSVIAGEDLREQGYGGLYGVGKAAEFPPALVTLKYTPKNEGKLREKISLVGKTMVYDTGGLSLKVGGIMNGMKCDMGGGAAVFSSFLLAAQLGSPHPLDCILCIADNAVGPRAQRNDDIVVFKSGRTCAINNTDAEGRLILSDGVWHAAKECGDAPAVILEMATLTGAQGVSTGVHHAGLYTNSGEWESKMMKNGLRSGDMLFPLVYAPEFHTKLYSSTVTDGKNLMSKVNDAGSSCAAHFVEANLPKDWVSGGGSFVHIDMAAPAFQADWGTGWGPALLAQTLVPTFQK